ncbi:MAG: Crp/Fnr family transcriptional regulator [Clostridia bacterium]|nr:Crp/Fnr family transcriptional regulator [Clostridia bacterium]
MDKKFLSIITESKIFKGADALFLGSVLDKQALFKVFNSGETVFSPSSDGNSVGIIISGNAWVFSDDEAKNVLLRTLSVSDVFGVSNLFSKEKFVSRIIAHRRCEVLFIHADTVKYLLENDKTVMYNYVNFLSDRICFLNRKISCLTAGSVERRLALYLCSAIEVSFDTNENDAVYDLALPVSFSSLATMLDVGRASLYRAFDRLEADGFITKNGNHITVRNFRRMIEFYN